MANEKSQMVIHRVLKAEVLKHLHFTLLLHAHCFLRVDNSEYHIRHIRQYEGCKALDHEVKSIDFVVLSVESVTSHTVLRF